MCAYVLRCIYAQHKRTSHRRCIYTTFSTHTRNSRKDVFHKEDSHLNLIGAPKRKTLSLSLSHSFYEPKERSSPVLPLQKKEWTSLTGRAVNGMANLSRSKFTTRLHNARLPHDHVCHYGPKILPIKIKWKKKTIRPKVVARFYPTMYME